ncbi:MAG TPA: hypothetical protein VL527_09420 [Dongiaceae bacterium]|nr:hypothetical protein [Dongiaceae bacterium]
MLLVTSVCGQTLQEALDATNLSWTTTGSGGSPGWAAQTTTSYDGVSAAKTLLVVADPNQQTATLQTSVTGPGTLTFWWKGSAPDFDGSQLALMVGSATVAKVSDYAHWTQQTVYLSAGGQTLKWVYTLPPYAPGTYAGYVDQVTWTRGSTAPVVSVPPFGQSVVPGLNATFYIRAGGTPPYGFQWQFNGADIPGATNASCTISNVQVPNLGTYRVVISNAVDVIISPPAELEFGQLAAWGYGANTDSRGTAPVGATNVLQISAGWQHNLLVRNDTTILNWGATNVVQANVPGLGSNIWHAAALAGSGAVLDANGIVSTWGSGAITNVPLGLSNVVALAQGPTASCCLALKSNGQVVAWGDNSTLTNVPANVSNIVSVAVGELHCLALRSDGTVLSWGDNSAGQRNTPFTSLYSSTNRVVAIAAGLNDSMALRSDGTVFVWGSNVYGQTNASGTVKGALAIAAGVFHCLALKTNGTVVAWGNNTYGQINVPLGLTNVVAIAAGGFHSLALVGAGSATGVSVSSPRLTGSNFSLVVPSQCGRVFELDYRTSPTSNVWSVLPLTAGMGTSLTLTDTNAVSPQRFYRIRRW